MDIKQEKYNVDQFSLSDCNTYAYKGQVAIPYVTWIYTNTSKEKPITGIFTINKNTEDLFVSSDGNELDGYGTFNENKCEYEVSTDPKYNRIGINRYKSSPNLCVNCLQV